MAKIRSSPRLAGRHDGQAYGSGYQHRNEEDFEVQLGPWDRIVPGTRVLAQNELSALLGGIIYGGVIQPLMARANTTAYSSYALQGVFGGVSAQRSSNNDVSSVYAILNSLDSSPGASTLWWRHERVIVNGSGEVTLSQSNPAQTSTINAGIGAHYVDHVLWGDYVYFMRRDQEHIYRADRLTTTFSDTAKTTKFTNLGGFGLFGNRTFIFGYDLVSGGGVLYWSVDSDPVDYAGLGSGSNPFPPRYGKPVDYAYLESRLFLFFTNIVVEATLTGSADTPFFFRELPLMSGARRQPKGVASAPDGVYYFGNDNLLHFYNGAQDTNIGERDYEMAPSFLETDFTKQPKLFFSVHANALFVVNTGENNDRMLVVHADTKQVIGTQQQVATIGDPNARKQIDAVIDAWHTSATHGRRKVVHFYHGPFSTTAQDYVRVVHSFDRGDVQNVDVTLLTGVYDVGNLVRLQQVDLFVQEQGVTMVAPSLAVTSYLPGQSTQTLALVAASALRIGSGFRYHVNRVGTQFQIQVTCLASNNAGLSRNKGITHLKLHFRGLRPYAP